MCYKTIMKFSVRKIKCCFIPCKKNGRKPYLLRTDFLLSLAVGFLIFRVVALSFLLPFSSQLFFAKIVSTDLVNLLNRQRASLNLGVLEENESLNQAAEAKARDMIENDYFAHTDPEGRQGWDWIRETGYTYTMAGENLAIGFIDAEEAHQAWNDSPSHKENLLNPRFKEIGIGVARGEFEGNTVTVVVQFFAEPEGHRLASTPAASEKTAPSEVGGEKTEPVSNEEVEEKSVPVEEKELVVSEEPVQQETPPTEAREKVLTEPSTFLITRQKEIFKYLGFAASFLVLFSLTATTFYLLIKERRVSEWKKAASPAVLAVLVILGVSLFDVSLLRPLFPYEIRISTITTRL